jgi:Domain of unknown function (DUF4190)
MICAHCSQENPEGRKFCRACAKPLGPEPAIEKPTSAAAPSLASATPQLSNMALASLILSFFSLIVPFGIAAVTLGHVSRKQIAKSGGRLRGTWLAFAALMLGYLQLAVAATIFLAGVGLMLQFNHELDKNHWARAALIERIKNGDPSKRVRMDDSARQQNAVVALRIIQAKQAEYLNAHPDEGYACRLDQLGQPLNPDTELGAFIANSRYGIEVKQCLAGNDLRYVVTAFPRINFNVLPFYCMDSRSVIYKYGPERYRDVIGKIQAPERELCPEDGERVEP